MRTERRAGVLSEPLAAHFQAIRRAREVLEDAPAEAVAEARDADREAELPHIVDARGDATDLPLVTLDPPGSRDLDQALHVEARGTGHRLRYAIADVAAHVTPGGALDRLAHERGVTVYCPDKRIGLHPPQLSEAHGSLLEGQRTKAVLWTIDIDASGAIGDVTLERVWVRSRRQYAYADVARPTDDEARQIARSLAEVGSARRAAVRAAGGVTLPKPSQEVESRDGRLYLRFDMPLPVEDDNAQISLATGMAGARLMLDAGAGVLRTMPSASHEAIANLRLRARTLGITWEAEWSYADVLDHLDPDSPATAAFLDAATGLFRGARWAAFAPGEPRPEPLTHGALGTPYAHVTAPLRRLVDRYATEACLAASLGRPVATWALDGFHASADDTASGASRANAVDRECIDAVESAVLRDRVGQEFTGVAIDDRDVQLTRPPVVARCDGELVPGEVHRVRLSVAEPPDPPRFAVVGGPVSR